MSGTAERLAAFAAQWLSRLEAGAQAVFVEGLVPETGGSPAAIADAFVQSKGFKPIGYNWEMLDPSASPTEPRSAVGTLAGAFDRDMEFPQQTWLGESDARACAADFVSAFDPLRCSVLTNRMVHGWHPLSDAAIEWAFVGFDQTRIALLLLTRG